MPQTPFATIGQNAAIDDDVTLGYRYPNCKNPLVIGDHAIIRSGSILYADTTIGHHFSCGHQALIRAESREQQTAQDFLNTTNQSAQYLPTAAYVTCYPAVPMSPQRIANRERAQMLIESCNRAALQQFLHGCSAILHQQNKRNILRWMIDVDPQEI